MAAMVSCSYTAHRQQLADNNQTENLYAFSKIRCHNVTLRQAQGEREGVEIAGKTVRAELVEA